MLGCVWKVKYDSKMLRVDADFLNTKKNIRFRNCQVTCERARKIWHKSGFGLVNYFYNKNQLSWVNLYVIENMYLQVKVGKYSAGTKWIYPSIHPSIHLSVCLSVDLPNYSDRSVCLSI